MVLMAAAGSLAMRVGAGMMGKEGARSVAGSILSTGGGGLSKKDSENLDKMQKGLMKIFKAIEKASPALQQQMSIINKTLGLYLRPIGDIMAKFLRPMAAWFLKLAVLWYKSLSGIFNTSGTEPQDLAEQQMDQAKEADIRKGEPDTASGVLANVLDNIEMPKIDLSEYEKSVKDVWDNTTKAVVDLVTLNFSNLATDVNGILDGVKESSNKIWTDFIPEWLITTWENLKEVGTNLWDIFKDLFDILKPIMDPLWTLIKLLGGAALTGALIVLNVILGVLNLALKGLHVVLRFVADLVQLGADNFGLFLQVLGNLADFIKDKLIEGFKNLWDIIKKVWDFITSIKLPSWLGGKKETLPTTTGHAVGGDIKETGLYQLHAGEKVITAGDNSRSSTKNFSFNPIINISANISNNMDVRQLAQQLADFQERELRRRVSYV